MALQSMLIANTVPHGDELCICAFDVALDLAFAASIRWLEKKRMFKDSVSLKERLATKGVKRKYDELETPKLPFGLQMLSKAQAHSDPTPLVIDAMHAADDDHHLEDEESQDGEQEDTTQQKQKAVERERERATE